MTIEELRAVVWRFRGALALRTLARLRNEHDPDPRVDADLAAPCRERASETYVALRDQLPPAEHAALGAHLLRAHAERAYDQGRALTASLVERPGALGRRRRPLREWLNDPAVWRSESSRDELSAAVRDGLEGVAEPLVQAQGEADAAVARAFATLAPARHPDASGEGDAAAAAKELLDATGDLMREASVLLARRAGIALRGGIDLAAVLRGETLLAYVRSDAGGRRVGEAWADLGLRDVLNRRVRFAPPHGGLWPVPQIVVREATKAILIAPAAQHWGVTSELGLLDASGRALGFALTSPGLPVELRHPCVASVARLLGALAVLAHARREPWQRRYGASRGDALELAQRSVLHVLVAARLASASVLARYTGDSLEARHALAEQALGVPLPLELGALLVSRLSPGGAARAWRWAPAVAAALRERFDEDWLRNPRAAEPLRGALLRGGEHSAEGFAGELGAELEAGFALLGELF